MADEIVIRTSDSPAKELRASRAVLAAHSTVFKDLFSMPNTARDAFVEVAETVEELAPFLSILTGTYDEPLELSVDGWVHLARLADKYDAKIARSIVEGQVSYVWLCTTPSSWIDSATTQATAERQRGRGSDAHSRFLHTRR